jgi:hypothetical protein
LRWVESHVNHQKFLLIANVSTINDDGNHQYINKIISKHEKKDYKIDIFTIELFCTTQKTQKFSVKLG